MTDLVEKVAEAIADSANEPVECLTQRSWARTDTYFLPNDRDRVAALAAINAVRLWDKSASAMQVREMTVEEVARVLFESRYPFSWDIASKRVLNENLYAEADQCRRDAKALAKLGTIRIVGD